MAVWLIRAGGHGEFEQKFVEDQRVYVTWDGLNKDLSQLTHRSELQLALGSIYPDSKPNRLRNWVSQIWPFAHEIKMGDLDFLPLKMQPAFYIGEVTSDYHFEPSGPDPFFHWRSVRWVGEAIPRSNFSQDLLYSLGAFLTICRITRNDAESRFAAMRANDWRPESIGDLQVFGQPSNPKASPRAIDLESLAQAGISQLISARFKGHALTRFVDGILRAQGYTTYLSPEGPDGGIDILAGSGPLGFGSPRLCVQVKSTEAAIDSTTLNELRGAMQSVQATEGLLVLGAASARLLNG